MLPSGGVPAGCPMPLCNAPDGALLNVSPQLILGVASRPDAQSRRDCTIAEKIANYSYICKKSVIMSKTKCLIHLVFATKSRKTTILMPRKAELYNYIFGILKNNNCFVHRINGMSDHVHILFDLNPSIALADIVKAIKRCSTLWLKGNGIFPYFEGWQEGYYAVSVGPDGLNACRQYIVNQEKHHSTSSFLDEIKDLILHSNLQWYSKDWE